MAEILGVNLKTIADFMDAAQGNYRNALYISAMSVATVRSPTVEIFCLLPVRTDLLFCFPYPMQNSSSGAKLIILTAMAE